jgi:TnpA family transposase
MSTVKYSHEQLVHLAKLTPEDMAEINQRRHLHNRLGFAYQLAYVRLSGAHWAQFPAQVAFVTLDELLTFVSVQLNLATEAIADYATRQQTISEHQEQIRLYLKLQRLGETETQQLMQFLFDEACRLEQISALLAKAEQFLRSLRAESQRVFNRWHPEGSRCPPLKAGFCSATNKVLRIF